MPFIFWQQQLQPPVRVWLSWGVCKKKKGKCREKGEKRGNQSVYFFKPLPMEAGIKPVTERVLVERFWVEARDGIFQKEEGRRENKNEQ